MKKTAPLVAVLCCGWSGGSSALANPHAERGVVEIGGELELSYLLAGFSVFF